MFILALAIRIKRSSGWRRRTEIGPTTWLISRCFRQTTRCVRTLESTTYCAALVSSRESVSRETRFGRCIETLRSLHVALRRPVRMRRAPRNVRQASSLSRLRQRATQEDIDKLEACRTFSEEHYEPQRLC